VTGSYVNSYGYDSAGRLTSATGRSMTWTKLDRMKTATVGTTNASYGYDGEGRRVRSTVDGAARYFVLDPWGNVLAEYDGSGTLLVEHVYLDGRRIGSHYSNGERAYYQQDAVGSAWIVTSKTGGTYDVYRYQPFGDAVDQFDVAFASLASFEIAGADIPIFLDGFESGTTAAWITCDTGGCAVVPEDLIEPRFTDKELDLETGLFYFEARSTRTNRSEGHDQLDISGPNWESPRRWSF
jgi:hypothetical protein